MYIPSKCLKNTIEIDKKYKILSWYTIRKMASVFVLQFEQRGTFKLIFRS